MVTALYRRYRPETFAEMIGQSQVTEPLMTALRTDRVNHAYLFSGPRGCGKTTSARILARCLNCAEGPTDVPCGVCPSCVELSRGGGGSLDVVEIDAASHNGVDDARDLRERAVFAPARDRFKIFILDEAHMVTPQGFNALLKLVEEPPEHIKFIFATTEPDKVLGTIRSRTHHYPFRLVPPGPMLEYVQQLCTEEGVEVAPGVLPLVVRAGGGSPRDALSLLDQLIAGSEGPTIDYERAVALLGYTHGALLDEVVDAIGAGDAAGAFAAADRVVQTGQDPRRFVEDLLERLRDLIVVAASSPEAAAAVLRGVPEDELARMAAQAAAFGQAELSRVADLVNQTLTEMTGATSPRLHLELMLARVLVPSADDTERGALARVERLERRVGVAAAAEGPAAGTESRPAAQATAAPVAPAARTAPEPARQTAAAATSPAVPAADAVAAATVAAAKPAAEAAAPVKPVGPVTLQQIRDAWPEVLASLQRTKRSAWMVAFTAQVRDFRDGDVLVLTFPSEHDVAGFRGGAPGQSVSELLRGAIVEVLGVRVKFIARVDAPGGAQTAAPAVPEAAPSAAPAPSAASAASAPAEAAPSASAPGGPSPAGSRSDSDRAPTRSASGAARPAPSGSAGMLSTAAATPAAATAEAGSTSAAPAGPVDSWATVAIPRDPTSDADAAVGAGAVYTSASARTATAVAERPQGDAAASDDRSSGPSSAPAIAPAPASGPTGLDELPDDADAPPEDEEPPFDPGPEPEMVVEAPAHAPAPAPAPAPARARPLPATARAAVDGGVQRYGEAVVREVLGATFLEEVEAPARPGFGERG
ncbi:DNA polymerase III subunit gamma and tau [Agromyces badenianii]|uniref:DNA-directed DNA polymerase n=1 Tax=Agromyces badenianii TaxID=2080742 RepID=A0A2S0WXK8_9MICO|nr:DNA polymerase III subunit gamma and tau [Agromyces badenianii]AWB96042.1 DNA polymerase III subunit gamma and tau [Agromyces badenianii]